MLEWAERNPPSGPRCQRPTHVLVLFTLAHGPAVVLELQKPNRPEDLHLLYVFHVPFFYKHTHGTSRELAAIRERLTTLGYQDGVDDGVQEAVQGGFDQGYAVGAAAGWEAGSLYGAAAAARAALVASHERPAEAGVAGAAHLGPAENNSTLEDGTSASCVEPRAGGGESESIAAAALSAAESTTAVSSQRRRLRESGAKDTAVMGAADGLQELVEELRNGILLGADGPGAPDRAEVLRRVRLAGPAGEAVADGLAD